MKKTLIFLGLLFWLMTVQPAQAIVDPRLVPNNRFGIHILEAEDLKAAADLVNSGGGQWGYVTIVMRLNDLNREKWQSIFDQMRRLKLIPLVRLATVPQGPVWVKPTPADADRFAEFLNSLNWVTRNRYVILFNEPNHAKEWGNEIKPHEYAAIVKEFRQKLKAASDDYFVLPAGLDTAAPNSKETMAAAEFWRQMFLADNDVFTYFDGWNSHSYPNPNFSGPISGTGLGTIRSYRVEVNHLSRFRLPPNLPLFITETGWLNTNSNLAEFYRRAFTKIWTDANLVAVTPFVLNYPQPPFNVFSWSDVNGNFLPHYQIVKDLAKAGGQPQQIHLSELVDNNLPDEVVANSDYNFFLELANLGQSIWEREVFNLNVASNLPPGSILAGHVAVTEPGESARIDINLKSPGFLPTGEAIKLSFQLVRYGLPFGATLEKAIKVVPPPKVLVTAKRWFKIPFDDDDYRLLVYDTGNQLLQESAQKNFGRFEPIGLYNVIPDRSYRLVLVKPGYLPRQTWMVLGQGDNLVYFKPLSPLDFDRSGHLSLADFWAWFKLPFDYLRFGLQPGN